MERPALIEFTGNLNYPTIIIISLLDSENSWEKSALIDFTDNLNYSIIIIIFLFDSVNSQLCHTFLSLCMIPRLHILPKVLEKHVMYEFCLYSVKCIFDVIERLTDV